MKSIYAEDCYFYRVNEEGKCAAKQRWCFLCGFHVPDIEGLQPRDYVGLASSRISLRVTFCFSIIALIVSIIALILSQ